jgi:hypothetical protein
MKRFNAILFVLLFLLSGITFGQYGRGSSEKYYREVGTALGTDSLNVNGLKKAIASLPDSGVVYINYPGLWDTTGLGTIPTNIKLNGYLFGKKIAHNIFYDRLFIGSDSGVQNTPLLSLARVDSNISPGWFGIGRISADRIDIPSTRLQGMVVDLHLRQKYDTRAYADYEYFSGYLSKLRSYLDTVAQPNFLISNFTSEFDNYSTKTIKDYSAYKTFNITLQGAGNITNGYGYASVAPSHTSTGRMTNFYAFHSSISGTTVTGGKYHFYGTGSAPSWFDGNVNSVGFNYAADTSSTDAYKMVLAGAHTLVAGLEVTFKAVTANTDGATLAINALTAKALTKATVGGVNTVLATGDIIAGQIVKAVYDGTQFQVISRLAQ